VFDIVPQTRYNSFTENRNLKNPMTRLKRDVVKYIRDKAKNKYEKGSACEICDVTEPLDFHHFYTLARLYCYIVSQASCTVTQSIR